LELKSQCQNHCHPKYANSLGANAFCLYTTLLPLNYAAAAGKHWYPFVGKQVSGEDLARIKTLQFLEERPKDKPFAATIAFYPPKPIGTSSLPVSN